MWISGGRLSRWFVALIGMFMIWGVCTVLMMMCEGQMPNIYVSLVLKGGDSSAEIAPIREP